MNEKRLDVRARVLREARIFFESRGFLEVETPVIVPCPGLDLHLDAFEVVGGRGEQKRYLSTSPEYQMKRLMADGHHQIFQITHAFRAGEFGERHNSEFTILEFYRAHAGLESVMRDTEQLVARVTGGFVHIGTRVIDVRPPLPRITVCEAYERYAELSKEETLRLATEDEERFFRVLVDCVEPALSLEDRGIFLTDYPASQASLARKNRVDPRFAERFELYVAGVELCNGFGELTDADEQRARFRHDQEARGRRGKPIYPIDARFLEALARGLPESGGNAIGLDRLIALSAGDRSIAPFIAFTDDEV